MGKASRQKPARLGEKLLQMRETLGLSQNEMIRYVGLDDVVSRNNLSIYESGRREPSVIIIMKFARAVGIPMEILVDDQLDLPKKLPAGPRQKR
ncbi:MAG: helix-turn-helix domain-containing protein [Blastocatellia bacterium]